MHVSGCPAGARYMIVTHRWPDSDFESGNMTPHGDAIALRRRLCVDTTRVVDSISCWQMYLRSYTFSREEEEETFQDKTRRCLGKLRKTAAYRKLLVLRKAREVSHNILLSICSHLLSCTTKINVASQ